MTTENRRRLNQHIFVTTLLIIVYPIYIRSSKHLGTDVLDRAPIFTVLEMLMAVVFLNLLPFLNNLYFKFRYKRISIDRMGSSLRIVLDTLGIILILHLIYNIVFTLEFFLAAPPTKSQVIISQIFLFLFIAIYSSVYHGIFYTRLYIQRNVRLEQIAKEKLSSEIQFLRSQFNAGLIYNTLDYIENLQNKNEALDLLENFSKILRYKIYEVKLKSISLKKEMDYTSMYIRLLNTVKNTKIDFNFSFDNENYYIRPLLLQTILDLILTNQRNQDLIKIWHESSKFGYFLYLKSTIHEEKENEKQLISELDIIIKDSAKHPGYSVEFSEEISTLIIKICLIKIYTPEL